MSRRNELPTTSEIYKQNWQRTNDSGTYSAETAGQEEDELNRNKIKIYKDFLITKDQKKNKNNELKPLFSKLMEQVKEFSNDKIQLMFVMKAQELQLKFKSGKKLKDVNTLKDIGKSLYTDKSQENNPTSTTV